MFNNLSVVRSPAHAFSYDVAPLQQQRVTPGADDARGSGVYKLDTLHEPSSKEPSIADAAREPSEQKQLEEALAQMNKAVQRLEPHLEFSFTAEDNRLVVKLVDGVKNEVLRQMPSDEMLSLARRLDGLRGLLVNEIV